MFKFKNKSFMVESRKGLGHHSPGATNPVSETLHPALASTMCCAEVV